MLQKADVAGLSFNTYKGLGHSVQMQELEDLKMWLGKAVPDYKNHVLVRMGMKARQQYVRKGIATSSRLSTSADLCFYAADLWSWSHHLHGH
jgi:hypothetical protein